MKKVVWLRIFRGNEILYKADGTPSNDNQIVKLQHGNIEWKNYLSLLSGAGLCVVKIVKVLIKKDGELVEVDIPDKLIEEVKLAHEGDTTIILTKEQKKIDDLEETNKKMQEQLDSLIDLMKLKSNGVDDIEEKVVERVGDEEIYVAPKESSLEDIKAEYKVKFGKKPHWKWSEEKIELKLAE